MAVIEKIYETVEGTLALYIGALILAAFTPQLFNTLSNATIFPYGSTTTLFVQLVTFVLAAAILLNIFSRKEEPRSFVQ